LIDQYLMNQNRILSLLFTLLLIGGLCLGAVLFAWGVSKLPDWAASQFGPAAPGIERVQSYYLSAQLLRQARELKTPSNLNGSEVDFQIELGESPNEITNRLQQEGLITNSSAIRDYLVYAGLDTTIQAGNYRLTPRMSPLEIAHALQDATPSEVTFNILPGWRMEEIAAALPTSGLEFTPQEFLAAASSPQAGEPLRAELPEGAVLEGFLYPGSYQVRREINPQAFVNTLVDQFRANLSDDLRQGFEQQNLNLYQAVILASIVQREAVDETEMPRIASVFLNRLQAGMKLDSDPTVQYALGYNTAQNTWWTNPLSQEDLQVNSPYNTYLNWGLPPGPIANPGMKALEAVAHPEQTPYYFFRAACDGSGKHVFSETFEQHVANACP
jgi:UPF0755 protein